MKLEWLTSIKNSWRRHQNVILTISLVLECWIMSRMIFGTDPKPLCGIWLRMEFGCGSFFTNMTFVWSFSIYIESGEAKFCGVIYLIYMHRDLNKFQEPCRGFWELGDIVDKLADSAGDSFTTVVREPPQSWRHLHLAIVIVWPPNCYRSVSLYIVDYLWLLRLWSLTSIIT